jgi:outer membrane immunogenic protein
MRALALASLLIFGVGAGSAAAADAITVPISGAGAVPVVSGNAKFDWNGFYAGVYGVVQGNSETDTQLGLGIDAGVNAQLDFFLVGGEVALEGLTNDELDTAYGKVLGKAGVILTDDVLVYASAGLGADLGGGTGTSNLLLGGGVELAVTDDLSVRAQYLHGFAVSGDNETDQVTLGANFHF